jgi:protein TonB
MSKIKAAQRRTFIVGAIIGIHVLFFIGLTAGLNRDVLADQWVTMQADMEEVKDDTPPPPPPPPPADFEPPPLEVPPSPDLPALVDAPAPANSIQIDSRPVQEAKPVVVERPPLVPPTKAVNFFRKNKPPYPSASRRLQEEGSVITQIMLAADGTASCSVVDSSGTPRLDEAVTKWCATKKFDPATRAGAPEAYTFKLKYTFRLEDE